MILLVLTIKLSIDVHYSSTGVNNQVHYGSTDVHSQCTIRMYPLLVHCWIDTYIIDYFALCICNFQTFQTMLRMFRLCSDNVKKVHTMFRQCSESSDSVQTMTLSIFYGMKQYHIFVIFMNSIVNLLNKKTHYFIHSFIFLFRNSKYLFV
jgi:hypothetical protein